jgi:hypothetical protein
MARITRLVGVYHANGTLWGERTAADQGLLLGGAA